MQYKVNNFTTKELKEKIINLKIELQKILGNWFYLKNVIYPQLEYKYNQIFGDLEKELEQKKEILKNLKQQIFKIKPMYHNNNSEEEDTYKIDLFNKIENAFNSTKFDNFELNINYEISYIYRTITKKIHPDTNPDPELFHNFWHNVQDAYKTKNIHKLRLFHKLICFEDYIELVTARNKNRAFLDTISELEKSIEIEKKKITKLMMQEPFIFQNQLDNEEWIEKRKSQINMKIEEINKKIEQLKYSNFDYSNN